MFMAPPSQTQILLNEIWGSEIIVSTLWKSGNQSSGHLGFRKGPGVRWAQCLNFSEGIGSCVQTLRVLGKLLRVLGELGVFA